MYAKDQASKQAQKHKFQLHGLLLTSSVAFATIVTIFSLPLFISYMLCCHQPPYQPWTISILSRWPCDRCSKRLPRTKSCPVVRHYVLRRSLSLSPFHHPFYFISFGYVTSCHSHVYTSRIMWVFYNHQNELFDF